MWEEQHFEIFAPVGSHFNENEKNVKISIFKIPKISNVVLWGTTEKIIQEKFDTFWLRLVEEVVFLANHIFRKIHASAPNDLKMTLNAIGQRYPTYVELLSASPKFHSVLLYHDRSFSRSLRFFIFPQATVVSFEIFENKSLKIANSKFKTQFCEDHWEANSGKV